MRGVFFIVILIAMLIVGILTIKDMKTETDGVAREKAVEKAEDATKQAEEAMERIKKTVKNIEIPSRE